MHQRSLSALLGILPLAGCAATTPCDSLATPPPTAACVVPLGGWVGDTPWSTDGSYEAELTGTVSDVGVGTPADGCFSQGVVGQTDGAEAEAVWFSVDDGAGTVWIVGYLLGGDGWLPESGDTVTVEHAFLFGGFGPDVGHISTLDADGELLAWVGKAGAVEGLQSPAAFGVKDGAAVCGGSDSCGSWSGYGLRFESAGTTEELGWGQSGSIDRYTVQHGGNVRGTDTTASCMDWYVGDVVAGAWVAP